MLLQPSHFSNLLIAIILTLLAKPNFAKYLQVNDIEIFQNFLNYQKLHHGLFAVNKKQNDVMDNFAESNLKQMFSHKRIRFFNVADVAVDFQELFYYNSPRVGIFVANLNCALTQRQVFEPASIGNYFNFTQYWLVMMDELNGSELTIFQSTFERYNINIDADITLGIRHNFCTVILYDVYKICHKCGSPLEILFKGNWTKTTGLNLLPEFRESFVRRRRDFHNVELHGSIGLLEKPESMNWTDYLADAENNRHLDAMQRKTYHLLKNMQNVFNFSLNVLITNSWGNLIDGNWTGVMGHLISGEAELGLCPLRFTLERASAIHFSPILHTEVICFLLRHPRRNIIRNIFLVPFVENVWWCVFALILFAIFLLRMLLLQECCIQQQRQHQNFNQQRKLKQTKQRRQQHERHNNPAPLEPRLDFSMLMILAAVFMQGPSPDAFNLISTRTLITTICFFSVMLLQFYGAFIVGSLLADAPRTITNIRALYNSTLDIGMENITYNYDFFINTTNQEAKDIYVHRIAKNPRGNILTMARGVERIGRGGFAFHTGVERAYRLLKYKLTEMEFCDLQEIALYPPFLASAVTRLGSPYQEHFTNIILHLHATGLTQYSDKMWQVKKTDCSLAKNTEIEVDIEHFVPAIAFLAFTMLITLFTLLLEMAISWWWCQRPKQQKKSIEHHQKKTKTKGKTGKRIP